jgi:lipid A ethanolaminephosphotransferase
MQFIHYISDLLYRKKDLSTTKVVIFNALFLTLVANKTFFQNVFHVYPLSLQNIGFLISLAVGITAVTVLLLTLLTSRYTTKFVIISLFLGASFIAYFMDNYHVVIDDIMVQNIVETDWREVNDLMGMKMFSYLILLGVLPGFFVSRLKLKTYPWKKSVLYKIRDVGISLLLIIGIVLLFSKFYTSFFREYKPLRYYVNPTYSLYSLGKFITRTFYMEESLLSSVGLDAQVVELADEGDDDPKELVVLVIGEAARADHFSFNGYQRETNPLLGNEDVINFSNMYSCGTSTAFSVPCMFSVFPRDEFSNRKGNTNENILDVLSHTKAIDILWRDNNSDSKGVALRVPYEDYTRSERNTFNTSGECRDEGMLIGLEHYINQHKGRDILIILHQMGNHGPAYYKRYPKKFEKFKPVCTTNQLEECSRDEIINAYDNALLYTDYFLSKVIYLLKKYDKTHETAMMYFSDHGESLGENGLYLHGMPYMIAPESQIHIGSLMWFGSEISKEIDMNRIRLNKDKKYSQDNLFHTSLGIFEVTSSVYNKEMDMLGSQ